MASYLKRPDQDVRSEVGRLKEEGYLLPRRFGLTTYFRKAGIPKDALSNMRTQTNEDLGINDTWVKGLRR